jgi:menaquinone-dependent protoporphyrinogen oxidase
VIVLVAAATRHGATGEIAQAIADALRQQGLDVRLQRADQVDDVSTCGAVVLGSAVYMGKWLPDALKVIDRHALLLTSLPVWLFSSGPLGDPPVPKGGSVDVSAISERIHARGHEVFAGKLDMSRLGLMEKLTARAVGAPEGDFRDWDAIRAWAQRIGAELSAAT